MTPPPRLDRDALLAAFGEWGKPRDQWRVGAEFERHLLRSDGTPVPYFGPRGVRELLLGLTRFGWEPVFEGEHPIALGRGSAAITLEPGGQFELSGSAVHELDPVAEEARRFAHEIDEVTGEDEVHQVALGFTPIADVEDIGWVPKGRYRVMREYLKETGPLAHHMMKGTCAVQASFDFADEADCARKVQLAIGLGPLTTALFANSPIARGRPTGFMSYRGHIWTLTDPRRTGFPEAAERFSFAGWVDYLLQVPMMFAKNAERQWMPAHGRTFADWMIDPVAPPVPADWDLHMTSVFPEVRVKRTIEVRGADCVGLPLAMSFVALFKGLFYCNKALEQATDLAAELRSHGTQAERFEVACRDGLRGTVGGRTYARWAEILLDESSAALDRCAPEDRHWLEPLVAQVQSGESPAHSVLRSWQANPDIGALIRASHMLGPRPQV